ncbi:MAG: FKBP-type peptidyl-prolyl cis-trans isomerase [Gammaproteobacteria bacterium]|nr:FKBP-type peptidyl-prolyl cis-trans isomerase [Gammaproteobacteria bacterium]
MPRLFINPASLFALLAMFTVSSTLHAEEAKVITEGSKVSLEYTLNIEGGETVDSNSGDDPLVYTQGNQEIIPALEQELQGLAAGDEKQVTLEPEDAYGTVDPDAFREVPLEQIPEEARTEGQLLVMQDQQGNQQQIKVSEIRDDTALLDLNHPLAGKTLQFDVKVVDVQ